MLVYFYPGVGECVYFMRTKLIGNQSVLFAHVHVRPRPSFFLSLLFFNRSALFTTPRQIDMKCGCKLCILSLSFLFPCLFLLIAFVAIAPPSSSSILLLHKGSRPDAQFASLFSFPLPVMVGLSFWFSALVCFLTSLAGCSRQITNEGQQTTPPVGKGQSRGTHVHIQTKHAFAKYT